MDDLMSNIAQNLKVRAVFSSFHLTLRDNYMQRHLWVLECWKSYAQKLVTVRLGGVLKLLDPVLELNPLNDFWQSICAAELPPFLLG